MSKRAMNCVYIIGQATGPVKIGISDNPDKRLIQIRNTCPFDCRLIWQWEFPTRADAIVVERRAHEELDAERLHGEWFGVDWEAAADVVEPLCHERMESAYPGRPY